MGEIFDKMLLKKINFIRISQKSYNRKNPLLVLISRAVLQLCSLNGFFLVKSHDFSQDLRDLRELSLLID